MIYLDSGATSFCKPFEVHRAVRWALLNCANPGRGGHKPAMIAAKTVLNCRKNAGKLFDCQPEQVVFTQNCTQGLNIAIKTLIKPGGKAVISGFEHNAVTRPLHKLGAEVLVAGEKLFDQQDTLERFEQALKQNPDGAIFTHVSNVFGYRLPIEQMAALCRQYQVPFAVDTAQSAGVLPISLQGLGADFIAMPGHKGLLGPQGTGILLCGRDPETLMEGGTGSMSLLQNMPDFLPDKGEAGTLNVPGIAGLSAGMDYLQRVGIDTVYSREHRQMVNCIKGLQKLGVQVFWGDNQCGTVSFVPECDCEELAQWLGNRNIAVRAGLHCAPLAHRSAGTLTTGTVRVSFGIDACDSVTRKLLEILRFCPLKL